jgi:hypothetical protein
MGICSLIDHELPRPGSAAGDSPSAHVLPLVLMLAGGGRTREDLRVPCNDEGLRGNAEQRRHERLAAAMGGKESGGLAGLQRVNRGGRLLPSEDRTAYTLDIDATQIVAQKCEIANSGNSRALRHATRSGPAANLVNLWVQPSRRWRPAGRGHGQSSYRRGPAWGHG